MDAQYDKDELARIEKYAVAHLDRAHTISAGATKVALAWVVGLAIVWFQQLEPRFSQVLTLQNTRLSVDGDQGIQGRGVARRLQQDDEAAKDQQLELPFSIKVSLHPWWVSTLWLGLTYGLTLYLLYSRQRVFRLAARGIYLLEFELQAKPEYVRALVGDAVWWLAPAPSRAGDYVQVDAFRRGLGWHSERRFRAAMVTAAVLLCAGGTRILYVGFRVQSYLVGIESPAKWLSITALDLSLFLGTLYCVWEWFSSAAVPDRHLRPSHERANRREALGAVGGLGTAWSLVTAVAFTAAYHRTPNTTSAKHKKHRIRKTPPVPNPPNLTPGLYVNQNTGTVHIAAFSCKRCLFESHPLSLLPISASAVNWNNYHPRHLRHDQLGGAYNSSKSVGKRTPGAPLQGSQMFAARPRPHEVHRTFMVEHEALALLNANGPATACSFLLDAIKATPTFGIRTGIRLYDLLAGLAIRYGRSNDLDGLIQVLRSTMPQLSGAAQLIDVDSGNKPFVIPRRFLVLSYMYRLSGNEWLFPTDVGVNKKRKHEHHHRSGLVSRSKQNHQKTQRPKQTHNAYLVSVLNARIDKWSAKDRTAFDKWSAHWKAQTPVKWSHVEIA